MRDASVALEVLRKSEVEGFATTDARVFERDAAIFTELSREADARHAAMGVLDRSLRGDMVATKTRSRAAWSAFERTTAADTAVFSSAAFVNGVAVPHAARAPSASAAAASSSGASSGSGGAAAASAASQREPEHDPFVHARHYAAALVELRQRVDEYMRKTARAYQEIKLAEGRRVEAFKGAMLEWLIAEKQLLQNRTKVRARVSSQFIESFACLFCQRYPMSHGFCSCFPLDSKPSKRLRSSMPLIASAT